MAAIGASARIFQILDRTPQMTSGTRKLDTVAGVLELRHLSFTYATRPSTKALDQITMQLRPGRMLALVGPSGSGKTTMASMMIQLYDPDVATSITLDGVPLSHFDLTWLVTPVQFHCYTCYLSIHIICVYLCSVVKLALFPKSQYY
jgi:ATP-binding cassette subfamily B (MDR/TAP) protein 1